MPQGVINLLSRNSRICPGGLVDLYNQRKDVMNKQEMISLLNEEMEQRNSKLKILNREGEIRIQDILDIQDKFDRKEVQTKEEAYALVAEAEHHISRLKELRQQILVMTMDVMFDLKAIYEAED